MKKILLKSSTKIRRKKELSQWVKFHISGDYLDTYTIKLQVKVLGLFWITLKSELLTIERNV